MLAHLRGMVRDNANDYYSNTNSTPIEILQHNRFREGYFKGNLTVSHGRHEIKAGVESDNLFLNEDFNYHITDSTQARSRYSQPTSASMGSAPILSKQPISKT